jgi:hypothetical protein
MSVVVWALGIVLALAGVVALGFGVRINEFSVGHALIIAGTTALVGGIVAMALASVIGKLARIAKSLEAQSAVPAGSAAEFAPAPLQRLEVAPAPPLAKTQPPAEPLAVAAPPADLDVAALGPPEPVLPEARPVETKPAADAKVDVSASAIERLRSSIGRPAKSDIVAEAEDVPLSPSAPAPPSARNGAGGHEPKIADHAAPNPNSAADTLKNKRLDFLFRSRAAKPPPGEAAAPQWPKRSGREGQNGNGSYVPSAATGTARPNPPPPLVEPRGRAAGPPPRPEPTRTAILKSGVVDGMAYTLYVDGSIEAQLPQGTVRFASITELRAHIENNS